MHINIINVFMDCNLTLRIYERYCSLKICNCQIHIPRFPYSEKLSTIL